MQKIDIPHKRLLTYLFILGLLPGIWAIGYVVRERIRAQEILKTVEEVKAFAFIHEKQQSKNFAVMEKFKEADHFYIDKHLETMRFLKPEIEALQKRLEQTSTANNEAAHRRLEFLQEKNRMEFIEGAVQTTPYYQETSETLSQTVEVNSQDLHQILSTIEQIQIGPYTPPPQSPQLMVLNFRMTKKQTSKNNEVFALNLKLLKREFL